MVLYIVLDIVGEGEIFDGKLFILSLLSHAFLIRQLPCKSRQICVS